MKYLDRQTLLAQRIQYFMTKNGMTQQSLLTAIMKEEKDGEKGIDDATLERILNGLTRDPRPDTLTKIARGLGVTRDDIIRGEPWKTDSDLDENVILRSIQEVERGGKIEVPGLPKGRYEVVVRTLKSFFVPPADLFRRALSYLLLSTSLAAKVAAFVVVLILFFLISQMPMCEETKKPSDNTPHVVMPKVTDVTQMTNRGNASANDKFKRLYESLLASQPKPQITSRSERQKRCRDDGYCVSWKTPDGRERIWGRFNNDNTVAGSGISGYCTAPVWNDADHEGFRQLTRELLAKYEQDGLDERADKLRRWAFPDELPDVEVNTANYGQLGPMGEATIEFTASQPVFFLARPEPLSLAERYMIVSPILSPPDGVFVRFGPPEVTCPHDRTVVQFEAAIEGRRACYEVTERSFQHNEFDPENPRLKMTLKKLIPMDKFGHELGTADVGVPDLVMLEGIKLGHMMVFVGEPSLVSFVLFQPPVADGWTYGLYCAGLSVSQSVSIDPEDGGGTIKCSSASGDTIRVGTVFSVEPFAWERRGKIIVGGAK